MNDDSRIYGKYHSFNVGLAVEVGVEKATLLCNLEFWLDRNKANKTNIHDGFVWTFNSSRAFSELFPYWNSKKIQRMLNDLEADGYIMSGRFNKSNYDQTKWYTTPAYSIGQNCPMQGKEESNRLPESVQPIPDINTDIKQTTPISPTGGDGDSKGRDKAKATYDKSTIVKCWNEKADRYGLPRIRVVSETTAKRLNKFYTKYRKLQKELGKESREATDIICRFIEAYEPSPYALGQNPAGKKHGIDIAFVDWFVDQELAKE